MTQENKDETLLFVVPKMLLLLVPFLGKFHLQES